MSGIRSLGRPDISQADGLVFRSETNYSCSGLVRSKAPGNRGPASRGVPLTTEMGNWSGKITLWLIGDPKTEGWHICSCPGRREELVVEPDLMDLNGEGERTAS